MKCGTSTKWLMDSSKDQNRRHPNSVDSDTYGGYSVTGFITACAWDSPSSVRTPHQRLDETPLGQNSWAMLVPHLLGSLSGVMACGSVFSFHFPPVRAKSTRAPHGVLCRSPGQLVFCADTWRRACGTSGKVDKESPKGCFTSRGGKEWSWGFWSCEGLTGLPTLLQRN